jgi:putative membrane protein
VSAVAQVAAAIAALVHLVVWVWEAFLIHRVHYSVFRQPAEHVPAIRLWAFGVGFYNLWLACGVIAGLIALHTGHVLVGQTLLIYTAWFMVLSAVVLAVADQLSMSRPRNQAWGGVAAEGIPPLVVLLFA